MGEHRHHDVEFKIAERAAEGDRGIVADNLRADLHEHLGHHRIHFAGHDRGAGLRRRQFDFAHAEARAGTEPADVVGDLDQADRHGFQRAAGFDRGIASALRFEMILGFAATAGRSP